MCNRCDWAQKYPNSSFSFHGRSDEVINVGGVRIGTGEIEAALFKHKKIHGSQSPLANCVVVGVSDSIKGDLPVAPTRLVLNTVIVHPTNLFLLGKSVFCMMS